MRTRFVIHKNLLSPVYKVLPRFHLVGFIRTWYPEDILVENPKRKEAGGWFLLPKSDYLPCNKHGVVKEHADIAKVVTCRAESTGGSHPYRENTVMA